EEALAGYGAIRRARVQKIADRCALASLILALGILTGRIRFDYPRSVDGEPLIHPVKVVNIERGCISLDDGRRIEDENNDEVELLRRLRQSDFLVDVEPETDGWVRVYARQKVDHCGTGDVNSISIPIFPVRSPRYIREDIIIGRVVNEPGHVPR